MKQLTFIYFLLLTVTVHSSDFGIVHEFKEQILEFSNQNPGLMSPFTSEEFEEILSDDKMPKNSCKVLIDENKTLLGFLLARPNQKSIFNKAPEGIKVVVIEKLGVIEKFRGAGIVRKLFHDLAEQASEQQFDEIRLLVFHGNTHARAVYERYGFDYVDYANDLNYDAFLMRISPQQLLEITRN